MYRVVRTDIRPSVDIPFFDFVPTPYVANVIAQIPVTIEYSLSLDTLTRTCLFTWDSEAAYLTYITDATIRVDAIDPREQYNNVNNIVDTFTHLDDII